MTSRASGAEDERETDEIVTNWKWTCDRKEEDEDEEQQKKLKSSHICQMSAGKYAQGWQTESKRENWLQEIKEGR